MAEFTNQTVHSVYVNGQQIMTVADTTATTDDVEYGKLFHQANGQAVIGLGNRRAFIKIGDSSTKPEEIENLRAGDLYIIKEDVAENPKTLKVYVYINKINEDGSLEETGSWHNISDLGYSIDKIEELNNKIEALIASDGDNSIRSIAQDEVSKVINSAPEAFDTLKEIADWISTPEGETALGAEQRISNVEAWIGDDNNGAASRLNSIETGLANEITYREEGVTAISNIIGVGLQNEDGEITNNLTDAIIDINKVLGSDGSENTLIGRVSDLETWKTDEGFQYGGNTIKGADKAIQDTLIDLNSARSAIRTIKKYSFGIEGGEIDAGFGEFSTSLQEQIDDLAGDAKTAETVKGNAHQIEDLWKQINLLQNKLNYAIFEPVKDPNSSDYILSYGPITLYDTASHRNWGYNTFIEEDPYVYSSSDLFYVPEGWQMNITVINKNSWDNKKDTTEFGFKGELNKSYDLYAQEEFKEVTLSSGYYSPYMGNGYGYTDVDVLPDPSKIEIDIKYCLI